MILPASSGQGSDAEASFLCAAILLHRLAQLLHAAAEGLVEEL